MNYPKLLKKGDTIGICAPSSGAAGLDKQVDNAISNVRALGYDVIETASVRRKVKCVSADRETRAAEFMSLYENPKIAAIIPPWGGEFLMDMLPHLDFERIAGLPAKWVCGYSDMSTMNFVLTVCSDIATVHGSNLMNMGFAKIHETDLRLFDMLSNDSCEQKSWDAWGRHTSFVDLTVETYTLDQPSLWKSLQGNQQVSFTGMMIGGCMDTICKLIGTPFAPVASFLEKYKQSGFIWALESCEMSAGDIYRTLWQMRECGWFQYANGIIIGRLAGYKDTQDFTLVDALEQGLGELEIPVIYDADIGHVPPQIQIMNGALGKVMFADGKAVIGQRRIENC